MRSFRRHIRRAIQRLVPACLAGWFLLSITRFLAPQAFSTPTDQIFQAHGVIEDVQPQNRVVVIHHAAISNYMDSMTMPFKVRDANELSGLHPGSIVHFELHVSADSSWVAHLVVVGQAPIAAASNNNGTDTPPTGPADDPRYALLHCRFTNELDQPVTLADFHGQALAITFFYTRCPLPDYCPRLSKNFQTASAILTHMSSAPTNWHFLSVTFNPSFDSPSVLHSYAQAYGYDPAHWSFLTGTTSDISELAERCGMKMKNQDGVIVHNFRTLIIDASGRLQMIFPTGGNLSDQIVRQIIQAASPGLPGSTPGKIAGMRN